MNEQIIPQNYQVVRAAPSIDYNIFIQELTLTIKRFELFLSGMEEIRDSEGNVKVIQVSSPKTNELGKKAIMSWVNTYVNPNTYLAENDRFNMEHNYDVDMMNILTELYFNLNEFEMSMEDADAIHSRLCQIIFHSLQRSITDKKYIFGSLKTAYTGQPMEQEKPKLWGLF